MGTTTDRKDARYRELEWMLDVRRRELTLEVQERLRGVRESGSEKPHATRDEGETADLEGQDDIELALIQMKAETLNKINEALSRLQGGRYGFCYECGREISAARLRALPFAVRCTGCEAEREHEAKQERRLHRPTTLFAGLQE